MLSQHQKLLVILTTWFAACTLLDSSLHAGEQHELAVRKWQVQGVEREALLWIPSGATIAPVASDGVPTLVPPSSLPVVFAFHGHGGTMKNAARTFGIHDAWPEAIVVYMQGLPTPGRLTDPEGLKSGWQPRLGDQKDRDLAFFDAVLATLRKEYRVDDQRIFATGHSNGGSFTYLLWGTRGDQLAAVAVSAAVPQVKLLDSMKPKPVMHIAGEKDQLVKYEAQLVGMTFLRKLNGSSEEGRAWAENCTVYEGTTNKPVVTMITPTTHRFPDKAPPLIVRFFKENAK